MIINTELSTVTFTTDEIFTFERLGDIVNALGRLQRNALPEWELDLLQESPQDREKRRNKEALEALRDKIDRDKAKTRVISEIIVKSDSDSRVIYRVKGYKDGHFECTCPDFEHRGHDKEGNLVPGYECKHIRRYLYRFYG